MSGSRCSSCSIQVGQKWVPTRPRQPQVICIFVLYCVNVSVNANTDSIDMFTCFKTVMALLCKCILICSLCSLMIYIFFALIICLKYLHYKVIVLNLIATLYLKRSLYKRISVFLFSKSNSNHNSIIRNSIHSLSILYVFWLNCPY